MSFPGDDDPPPELTTTRIGGGRTAWLIALGAAVLLGSVVYIGLSGHSSSPGASAAPNPSNAPFAVAAPSRQPQVESVRADPTAPLLYQYLGTALTLGNRGTLAILDQVAPSEYRGSYRIPYSLVQPTAHLEFDSVTASVSHDESDVIGAWTVPLNLLTPGSTTAVILDESVGPTNVAAGDPDFQAIATNGFHLTVTTEGSAGEGIMTIDVTVNPDPKKDRATR